MADPFDNAEGLDFDVLREAMASRFPIESVSAELMQAAVAQMFVHGLTVGFQPSAQNHVLVLRISNMDGQSLFFCPTTKEAETYLEAFARNGSGIVIRSGLTPWGRAGKRR